MAQLTEDDLKEIETDARSRFSKHPNKELYFGPQQAEDPSTFAILRGFRKSILAAVLKCQEKNFLGVNVDNKRSSSKAISQNVVGDQTKHIEKMVESGILAAKQDVIDEAVRRSNSFTAVVNDDGRAEVKCALCDKVISILKSGNQWKVSNIITHLRLLHPSEDGKAKMKRKREEKAKGKTAVKSSPGTLVEAFKRTKPSSKKTSTSTDRAEEEAEDDVLAIELPARASESEDMDFPTRGATADPKSLPQ